MIPPLKKDFSKNHPSQTLKRKLPRNSIIDAPLCREKCHERKNWLKVWTSSGRGPDSVGSPHVAQKPAVCSRQDFTTWFHLSRRVQHSPPATAAAPSSRRLVSRGFMRRNVTLDPSRLWKEKTGKVFSKHISSLVFDFVWCFDVVDESCTHSGLAAFRGWA